VLRNFFKIALRHILKHRTCAFINIIGLAIGMTSVILILLWIHDETSYDRFFKNADQIYRVLIDTPSEGQIMRSANTPNALGAELYSVFPEVKNFTRFLGGYTGWSLQYEEKSYTNDRWAAVDSSFFEIFSFPFVSGDAKTALAEPYSIVITDDMAAKYFGKEKAFGKILKKGDTDLLITGIIRMPQNSHLQFDYAVPIVNMEKWWYQDLNSWEPGPFKTYIQLAPDADVKQFRQKIAGAVKKHNITTNVSLLLQPLKDIYLKTNFKDDGRHGNIAYVYIALIIVACILLIACINFINLSIARSSNRYKEVGLKKVIGAKKINIAAQFMGEALITSVAALILAMVLVELFLPAFNILARKQLSLTLSGNQNIFWIICAIGLGAGFISGSYPSIYLASLAPALAIKNQSAISNKPGALRKLLIMMQFTVAIALFISTTIIYNQLGFMRSKDVGFERENIIYFLAEGRFKTHFESVRDELLQQVSIQNISRAFPPFFPGDEPSTNIDWEGKAPDVKVMMSHKSVDYDYQTTFNMEMADGRFFSRQHSTDVSNYVVNESAVKAMGGLDAPIGKRFFYNGQQGTIIGVLKDFHQSSLHNEITPMVFQVSDYAAFICIKFALGKVQDGISFLEEKWTSYVPDIPFSFRFFDEFIDGYYHNEQRIRTITQYFAFLTLLISCLGLFGLISYSVENRTREIGIRKAIGASVQSIVIMLSGEFTKWVLLANIFAWPLAWYIMQKWLQNFAYRVDLTIWPFLFAGSAALVIAFLTISWQTIRAATANPVKALRYE
jgi:putative ABC transport system permease protein